METAGPGDGVWRGPLDAYGHMLLDHLAGIEAWQIVERHDGFIRPGVHPSHYFADHDAWPPVEREAVEHVTGRVLDVGCGAGRFLRYLAARGHPVVGVDNSEGAVEACREQGLATVRALPLHRLGPSLGTFDTILLLGGNLGLLGEPRRGRAILRRWKDLVAPNGRILAASRDPRVGADRARQALIDVNEEAGRPAGTCRLRIRYREYATPWFDHVPLSVDDLRGYVEDTGWGVAEVFDHGDEWGYVALLAQTS